METVYGHKVVRYEDFDISVFTDKCGETENTQLG